MNTEDKPAEMYMGYSLFPEVEDGELQSKNRAVCLYNIFSDNAQEGRTTAVGLKMMSGYLSKIPKDERGPVVAKLALMANLQGNA